MQSRGRSLVWPVTLVVACPLLVVSAGGAARVAGLSLWATVLWALLVPWALLGLAALVLAVALGRTSGVRVDPGDDERSAAYQGPALDLPRQWSGKEDLGAP